MKNYILAFAILSLAACSKSGDPPSSDAPDSGSESITLTNDNLLESIKLADLEGNPIDLKSYQGKTVFLNFWATWCKPCIQEMPSIERAQQALEAENFVFLLASDETSKRIKRFQNLQDFNLNFVKLNTPFPDLGIYSIPTTMVIDPQGKIMMNQVGAMEWDTPEILEKLRSNNM